MLGFILEDLEKRTKVKGSNWGHGRQRQIHDQRSAGRIRMLHDPKFRVAGGFRGLGNSGRLVSGRPSARKSQGQAWAQACVGLGGGRNRNTTVSLSVTLKLKLPL